MILNVIKPITCHVSAVFCANTFQIMVQPPKMSLRDSCPISRNRLKAFGNHAMPKRQTTKTEVETRNYFVLQDMDSESTNKNFLANKKFKKL